MKKLFALLAVVLGVVSCMKDQSFEAGLVGDGNYVLTVALPDAATRAAGSDSAKGAIGNISLDEYDIRYTLEVYDANGELAKEDQQFSDETSATFALRLIPGRDYRFVVWADFVKNGVAHYNVADLREVELVGNHNAMDESRDAYTAVKLVEGFNSASEIDMELIRPFAKLRIVTNDMNELYSTLDNATVKYTTPIYTTFNALTETAGDLVSNVEKAVDFTEDAYKYAGEPKNGEQTLFADYIFGAKDGVVMFTFDVADDVQALPQVTFNTNIPVERNHLTTIYGPILTDANEVSVEIKDAFAQPENIVTYPIEDANTLARVLTSNEKHINATLGRDIDLPISSLGAQTPGSGEYKLGGEATETINIDLNGHKLNITTTYWSGLGAKNENALFTIKNGTMTSSQPTGTWNSYDLTFANCNYVFEDVVFDKAIALSNVGEAVTRTEATIARKSVTMKNVTINETHDYYAMWITAEGQTVNIEGLTINSLGRGIKIDEQYVDAPAKVTLNINGADFNTKKKAAIIVKSVAGADITLSNVDIADVAEDSSNEVWVDEDAANTINKVNVIGGSMIVEGQQTVAITDMETLKEELTKAGQAGAGYTVLEITSDIDMTGATWTPIKVDGYNGADIVTIDGKGHTIKGLTSSLFAGGFAGGSGIVIKNLTIADSKMVADNTQGYGAFVNCADSMDVITLVNCHLKDSSIITPNNGANESRIGGLVGWTAGYNNQNDGPVDSYITIENCSVVNCTLKCAGSIGAICGHAGANAATFTTIKDCTITGNKLISTDDGGWRTGVVVGTANNGQCVISNITESGNTLTQTSASDFKNPTGATRHYYGRFVPAGTGHLTIDGVEIEAGKTIIADGVFKKDGKKAYYINNAAGLVYISNNAPESGAAVKLDADINLEGVEFNGLKVQNWSGKNTFDGQNYTVSNWTYNGGAADMGFIRQWIGPVKNVKFENCHLNTGGRSAVVAGKIYGNIDNVSVNNCSIEDSYWACGLVAGLYNAGSVSNVTVTNSSVKSNGGTAAIVGVFNEEGGERGLKNCSVSNTTINNTGVYGEAYTGGALVGMFNSGATFTIEGCTVSNNTLEGGYVYEKYPADESVTIIEK